MTRTKRAGFLILLMASVTMAGSFSQAGESFYRWKDQWGNPVHSDRPPPTGIDYEIVSSGTSLVRKVDSSDGAVPVNADPKSAVDKKDAKPAPRKKDPELCARAQENMTTLNTRARIRLRDEKGEIHYLSEEDKEAQREEARILISVHCD